MVLSTEQRYLVTVISPRDCSRHTQECTASELAEVLQAARQTGHKVLPVEPLWSEAAEEAAYEQYRREHGEVEVF